MSVAGDSAAMRQLRGLGAGLLLLPAAAGAAKPVALDAALLDCWRDARAIDARATAILARMRSPRVPRAELIEAADAVLGLGREFEAVAARAAPFPARTPEGLRAKAHTLLLACDGAADVLDLARSLALDLVGGQ